MSVFGKRERCGASAISDEEARRVLSRIGGQEEGETGPELEYPVSIALYDEDNIYEVARHSAYVYEDAIEIDEVTIEKGPFDKYGLRHKVVGADFAAFKEALGASGPAFVEAVRARFSGEGGIGEFRDFCQDNGIKKTTYLIR